MDCSPLGSSVHGIFQARIVEWVALSFSRRSSPIRDRTCVSCIGRQSLYRLSHQGSPYYKMLGGRELPAAAAAKLLQSCPTLCNPIDRSPPGSPIPGILQARTLEWVAISFSNAWKWEVKVKWLSRVGLFMPTSLSSTLPSSLYIFKYRKYFWTHKRLPTNIWKWGYSKRVRVRGLNIGSLDGGVLVRDSD